MAIKEISVYKIDYEMRDKEEGEAKLWSACIAAYDQREAVDYLGTFLGRTFKILQLGRECGLHAMTDQIRQKVIDGYLAEIAEKEQKDESEEVVVIEEKPVGEPTKTTVKARGRSISKK